MKFKIIYYLQDILEE